MPVQGRWVLNVFRVWGCVWICGSIVIFALAGLNRWRRLGDTSLFLGMKKPRPIRDGAWVGVMVAARWAAGA